MTKKILIVINSLVGGGAEKVLVDILNNINNKKYDIDILLINKEGIYLDDVRKKYKVEYIINSKVKTNINIILRKLNSLIRLAKIKFMTSSFGCNKILKNNYDIEISFLEGYSTRFIANRKNDAKKIAWVHIDLYKYKCINRKIERNSYNKIDKIIAVSYDTKNSIELLYPELKDKTNIIYNPIDSKKIIEMSKECIEEIDSNKLCDNNYVNFITIGRLTYQKGYDILLKAHKELIDEGYNHRLYILGEGNEYDNLSKYVQENNLSNTAYLLGFKKNPYPYLKQADVFISSSRYEGFALVIGEAMVLGKPIIATKCAGPRELLNDGEFGMLVETDDIESLKNSMKQMILDKEKQLYYTNKSLERSNIFNLDKTINEIENLFDNI